MRIYFSAAVPCVLRVGGAPAGFLSGNELCADVDEHIPAEFIPIDANLLPLAFVAGESFFTSLRRAATSTAAAVTT